MKSGFGLMTLGVLLLLGAAGLTAYNVWEDEQAWRASMEEVQAMRMQLELMELRAQLAKVEALEDEASCVSALEETQDAEACPPEVILPREAWQDPARLPEEEKPLFLLSETMNLPIVNQNGIACVGILEIPEYGLSLPVAAETAYSTLKKVPCLYTGTPYAGNLIINAHNYPRHFGHLKEMTEGTTATFTDMDGNVFQYTLVWREILQPEEVEKMLDDTEDQWDLTLFTCTLGGKSRVTARFKETGIQLAQTVQEFEEE